jgi:Zn-dependent protease with chaperone function
MPRRPRLGTLALLLPLTAFVLFGMARVAAPVSLLGLVFDEPIGFGVFAVVFALLANVLLFIRPVEIAAGRFMAGPSREPDAEERARLDPLIGRVAAKARIRQERLVVRIQPVTGVNASAGASHLLYITRGALQLPDQVLEAVVAHELGHHRALHPLATAIVWSLSFPGVVLNGVFGVLRRLAGRFRPLVLLVLIWQATVMWLYWIGDLLAAWAARRTEFEADAAAGQWGYGMTLGMLYAELASQERPLNRLGRLRADHPPTAERVRALAPYAVN